MGFNFCGSRLALLSEFLVNLRDGSALRQTKRVVTFEVLCIDYNRHLKFSLRVIKFVNAWAKG